MRPDKFFKYIGQITFKKKICNYNGFKIIDFIKYFLIKIINHKKLFY